MIFNLKFLVLALGFLVGDLHCRFSCRLFRSITTSSPTLLAVNQHGETFSTDRYVPRTLTMKFQPLTPRSLRDTVSEWVFEFSGDRI